ncbi:MAG: SRPBCC domain-containing protein [Rhizobiales bacterium]|nr:SRPBCC domain-containing protein [Hyphomicrobiales bacterium]MBI3672703.1 SRPBCC domain-containing protein [Hyphomicrobiales bacterium]
MTATLSLETSIIVEAPRSKVFAAWTDASLIRKWFAPGTMKVSAASADARVGGSYSIAMKGEEAAPTVTGEYREVVKNQRLVFTWGWEGDPSPKTLVTVTFRDAKGGTKVVVKHARFADENSRARHLDGWNGCLANLKTYLAA